MKRMRPLGWLDALILLASAFAAGALVVRHDREAGEQYDADSLGVFIRHWPDGIRPALGPTLRLGSDFEAALIVMTLGLGLIALRRPFVRPGHKWPGRGMAAIAVAAGGLIYGITREALVSGTFHLSSQLFVFNELRFYGSFPRGAILGAWSLLALAGRWRSDADGFERLGRLLGWCWLASFAFDLFRSVVW